MIYKGVEYVTRGVRRCEHCGSATRMRLNQKYCCDACRQADYRWRKEQRDAGNNTKETPVS